MKGNTITLFEPYINCGFNAGEKPMCWNGEPFNTEKECEEWIEENQDNFTLEELGGGIYPKEVK